MHSEMEIHKASTRQALVEALSNIKLYQRIEIHAELDLSISTGIFISETLKRDYQVKVTYFYMTRKIREIDFINLVYEKFSLSPSGKESVRNYFQNYLKSLSASSFLFRRRNELVIFDNYGSINQNVEQAVQKLVKQIDNPIAFIYRECSPKQFKSL